MKKNWVPKQYSVVIKYLKQNNMNKLSKKQAMLIILDGWGYREEKKDNAILQAKTPIFDSLWKKYPHCLLKASGNAVGLPEGQMGNSEVGHTTIGAGKPADTDLVRIDKAISNGSFATNHAFTALFQHIKKNNSILHVQGLVSDGGVHSHQNHLFAFLKEAEKQEIKKIAIHIFTDGRDTPPQSASEFIKKLESLILEINSRNVSHVFIATISGRYYAMDRDNNWDRLAKVEQAMFECKGNICNVLPSKYIEDQYKDGKNDELLEPTVCVTEEGNGCALNKNDGVFFFNFRADRARMLTQKLIEKQKTDNIYVVTLTEYCIDYICHVAFPPTNITKTLGSEISQAGYSQSHIAETEKFAHATYFLNGGKEKPYEKETDIMLPSRKDIKTHDEAPEMRAEAIADKAIEELNKGVDFIFINFANPDMVGHTANVPAIIKAVETVDAQLGRIISVLEERNGIAFITADHGNAEVNIDPITNTKHTSHTTNPVPAILTDLSLKISDGALYDIAPTILKLMSIEKPSEMTGNSLV